MIRFEAENNKIILLYSSDQKTSRWVYHEMEKSGCALVGKVFSVTAKELLTKFLPDYEDDFVKFEVAIKEGEYYRFPKDILSLKHDLYIHESVKLERKIFVAERGISIFSKIDDMVQSSIYIGGDKEGAISLAVYLDLLRGFPNSYELKKYALARISSVLSSYIDTKDDYEVKYQKYMNKKISKKGANLKYRFSEMEVQKYEEVLDKLNIMLNNEISYNEAQWQEELLQIVLLLYPKYIHVFKEVSVRDTYNETNRSIDYLLIDSCGNTDIIEIKKPFDKCIVTQRTYRDNYIPLSELSGAVMQIEKYIFYLNKWGIKGEKELTKRYREELAENFQIKITNPGGIIIMGRKKGLSVEQLQDFEVIKRKYKNVIDIITYDDLIERLKFTIRQWKGIYNKSK